MIRSVAAQALSWYVTDPVVDVSVRDEGEMVALFDEAHVDDRLTVTGLELLAAETVKFTEVEP